MTRIVPTSILFSAALLFAATSCQSTHAHGKHPHEGDPAQKHAAEEEGDEDEEHEHELPAQPATSLGAAIATAMKSVPDGRFLQAEVESEDGKMICSIVLASGDGQREVNIDAASGKVLATEDEALEPENKVMLEALKQDPAHAPIGAVQAIEAAQAKLAGSWALAAALTSEEGPVVYTVLLVQGQAIHIAEVSPADGKVLKLGLAEQEEGEEGEEHEAMQGAQHEPEHETKH